MLGIIYCIKEKDKGYDSPVYIGSTTNFYNRKKEHKSNCININSYHYNVKVYQYIRDNDGWDNFEMLEIGFIDYEKDIELRECEQMWIDDLGATLNSYNAIKKKNK